MSVEENKAVSLRFFNEIVNKGNVAVLDEIIAPDYVDHSGMSGPNPGREGPRQLWAELHDAVPDFQSIAEDVIAEGDRVAMRFTASGTPRKTWMGIPATGKQFAVPGMSIHRHSGGKIVENWANIDMLGLLQQLGVIPAPSQAGR